MLRIDTLTPTGVNIKKEASVQSTSGLVLMILRYQKLYDASGILVLPDKQKDSQGNGASDVTEVKQIEDIIFGKP